MTVSKLFIISLLLVTSATAGAGARGSNPPLTNSQALGSDTQNTRALDSDTQNDEALGIHNPNNQNNTRNTAPHRPGQIEPVPSESGQGNSGR